MERGALPAATPLNGRDPCERGAAEAGRSELARLLRLCGGISRAFQENPEGPWR